MSTLNFIITDAGRQAAITADATGIQLTITEVGYGTGTWIPDSTATALQSELKRLVAGGGENPAPLYVHIAVTDQSSDSYQANEVGIYAGDVLFAVWSKGGQTAADGPGKINTQDSAFVFDLLLDNVPPDSVTVGDANFSYPLATETKPGVSEIATQAEVNAGTDNQRFIVPSKLKSWWDSVRTWSNIKNKPDFGSAALVDAGKNDGQVALIGDTINNQGVSVIVSSGNNSRGTWEKWSDGKLIQYGYANGVVGAVIGGNWVNTLNFPISFISNDICLTYAARSYVWTSYSFEGFYQDRIGNVLISPWYADAAGATTAYNWQAVGKWK